MSEERLARWINKRHNLAHRILCHELGMMTELRTLSNLKRTSIVTTVLLALERQTSNPLLKFALWLDRTSDRHWGFINNIRLWLSPSFWNTRWWNARSGPFEGAWWSGKARAAWDGKMKR